jgi:hypothetical protein
MRPLKGKLILSLAAFAALSLGSVMSAQAGTITYSTGNAIDLSGTGFGTRLTVLSLQANGTESGATTFDNPTGTGDSTNQDGLLSFAQLQSIGITSASEIQLIYNLNETGSSPGTSLTSNVATFYNSTGGVVATATLSNTFTAEPFNQGNGGSGYIATFNFTPAELAAINALFTSGGFFGLSGTIQMADNGADSFFVRDNGTVTAPIPEPATMILLGTGLAGIAAKVRKRRKGEPEETV